MFNVGDYFATAGATAGTHFLFDVPLRFVIQKVTTIHPPRAHPGRLAHKGATKECSQSHEVSSQSGSAPGMTRLLALPQEPVLSMGDKIMSSSW